MLSDLPRDLAEEVLIRLPVKSMRAVRSVCKEWNTLSKGRSFTKRHLAAQAKAAAAARECLVAMVINYRVYLMSVNLHGIHNNVDPSINHQGKLVSLTDPNRVDISVVYHCDGLLLCINRDRNWFVVWNPFSGQTRWFEPIGRLKNSFAIGYENSKSGRSYKVFGFCQHSGYVRYELQYINSNSFRDITIRPDWHIESYARGVSLKGNTYWFAMCLSETPQREFEDSLICFDFTKERFGPRLSLPFHSYMLDTVTLSSVRDEQLAALWQRWDTAYMEVWITTKIEPEEVSWNKKFFLAVDMEPQTFDTYQFGVEAGSFFVDEEKKVVVVFDTDRETKEGSFAHIIGEDGYFKKLDCGESPENYFNPLMCSYVPSLAQIKRPGGGTKKIRRKNKHQII